MAESKQAYRSELGILRDILFTIDEGGFQGVIISAVSRRANLSHYAVLEKTQKLIDAGLVETMTADRNRIYKITEKGIKFSSYLRNVEDQIRSFGLGDSIYRT